MSEEKETPPHFLKQQKETTMEVAVPPGFTTTLIMQHHQQKEACGESAFTGSVKRCSLRPRVPPKLFVPTHSRPVQRLKRRPPKQRSHLTASQPLRRGRGRPPKRQRSDGEPLTFPSPYCMVQESPASRPSRRHRGRPRKQRSDEAPSVSPPATPLGSTGNVPVQFSAITNALEPVAAPPGPPLVTEDPSVSAPASPLGSIGDVPIKVSVTTNASKPPLGSSSYRPLDVPSSGEEEERETKLKLTPLLKLKKPPKPNNTPEMLDEELKKVIHKVEYLLVQKLLTPGNDVDCMVHQANATFIYLKGFGVDYGSFYRDVKEYIEHRYNLHDAEREEALLSLSVYGRNYLIAIHNANAAEEVVVRTQGEHEKVNEKMGTLERQIEDLKQEDERLKRDIIKYKEAHEAAEAKRQELGAQLEAAHAKLREIKQRKNAALEGIECATLRLESTYC
ncbi:putative ripening-related protein 2-like [Capsicum annuum]|nr:putative ripening-related protein 2-like [Capsicum annuum]KAF3683045.1 putative ripening-related protein 2-like [Capsicum annuum]